MKSLFVFFYIIFLSVIFLVLANIYHLHHEKNILRKREQKLRFMIKERKKILRDFKQYKLTIEKIRSDYLSLVKPFRFFLKDSKIINFLFTTAKECEITLLAVQPVTPKQIGNLTVFSYKIEAEGECRKLYDFLRLIFSSSWVPLAIVENLELRLVDKNNESFNGSNNLQARISPLFYQEKIPFKEFKTLSMREKNIHLFSQNKRLKKNQFFRDPFAIAHNSLFHIPLGLNFWSLEEFELVGVLKYKDKNMGIILDPDGDIYKVFVKDKIGRERRSISYIDDKTIFFSP